MDFLQLVKEKYGFDEVQWGENQEIQTNHGKKIVYFWKDDALLDWHIKWRDYCSQPPLVLTNRMLRTQDGKAAVEWEAGWFTLHDEVATLATQLNAETVWGLLFGKMLNFGIQEKNRNLSSVQKEIPSLKQNERFILETDALDRKQKNVLIACMREGETRISKGQKLIAGVLEPPLLDRIESLEQGRSIFQMLYWQGTKKPPEKGLGSLVEFLQQWYVENGEASVLHLLDTIEQHVALKERYGKVLIGEAFLPWEFIDFIDKLKFEHRNKDEIDLLFDNLIKQWDERRHFVMLLSEWVNGDRKKVATS